MAVPDGCDWVSLTTVVLTCLLTLSEFLGWTHSTEINSVSQAVVKAATQILDDSPCNPRPVPDRDPHNSPHHAHAPDPVSRGSI